MLYIQSKVSSGLLIVESNHHIANPRVIDSNGNTEEVGIDLSEKK